MDPKARKYQHAGGANSPASELADTLASIWSGPTTSLDTHVHSTASDGPAAAALGFIGCPECYSPPEKVYDQARERGMDLVTITDHDTIAGGLELVERGFERFILGQEVTVHFPEDRCKLHVLVWGLSPEHAEQIDTLRLRDDVYQFAAWLREHELPHALAHPLYIQNGKLSFWHIERAALLFRGFEVLNGAHSATHRKALERFLDALTPAKIADLASLHDMQPLWPEPHRKSRTAGSDDHALLNVGRTYTEVPGELDDPRAFFGQVMSYRSRVSGVGGHPSLLAHQLSTVGAHYTASRLRGKGGPKARLVRSKLMKFAGVGEDKPSKPALVLEAARNKLLGRRRREWPLLTALRAGLGPVLERHPELRERLDPETWTAGSALAQHERMEQFSEELVRELTAILSDGTLDAIRERDRRGMTDHAVSQAIVQAAQLPYVFGLFHQNKERWFLERLQHNLDTERGRPSEILDRPIKVKLFTDTLGDVNGVTRFIRTMASKALEHGHDLEVLTSTNIEMPEGENLRNFKPLFASKMPKYENLELVLPPVLEMMRHIDREQPDVIHISTPGPVGLVGLIAAKMVRVPVVGVYHTDFPAYVDRLFEDHILTEVATGAMRRFYRRFATVLTRSKDYVPIVSELGVPKNIVSALKAGCDTRQFSPAKADASVWRQFDLPGGPSETNETSETTVKAVFCGRVSVEKNLPMLVDVWKRAHARLAKAGVDARLVVIGDGPYREKMQRQLRKHGGVFAGFRHGDELSAMYASADAFCFPSETDTLGQAVMEAQASGLPAIVATEGGPKEIVEHGQTGYAIDAADEQAWEDAIVELLSDADRRRAMGERAVERMGAFSVDAMFDDFWSTHERTWRTYLRSLGIDNDTDEDRAVLENGTPVQPGPRLTPSDPAVR